MLTGTGKTDVRIGFHAGSGRTVYLVIDRAGAPLTGSYVTEIDAEEVTYDATSEAPADVDALLEGIAAGINADAGAAAIVTADAVAMAPGGALNAIRLRAVAGTYWLVGAATAYPSGADLEVYGEITSASARLWARQDSSRVGPGQPETLAYQAIRGAWHLVRDLGVLSAGGIHEYALASSVDAVWIELYDVVVPSDGVTVTPIAVCTCSRAQLT